MAAVRTSDKAVRMTADDAAIGKLSAISRGYYKDEFLKLFVRKPARRPPLINRGYYARVAAFDKLVASFLDAKAGAGDAGCDKQVVCLGAGLDTTALRLKQAGRSPALFVELDMRENVRTKVGGITRSAAAMALLGGTEVVSDTSKESPSLVAAGYSILPADLRDTSSVQRALASAGVDARKPTLFISECVLIYLQPDDSNTLIQWVAKTFPLCAFAAYEQILPDDAFGRMMQKNLAARNIVLHGLKAHPTLQSQERRFMDAGFTTARAWDMNDVYYKYLPAAERQRVERLEFMDEVEEWHLLQGHYCVTVAVREGGAGSTGTTDGATHAAAAGVADAATGTSEASTAEAGQATEASSGAGAGAGAGGGAPVCSAASPLGRAEACAGNGPLATAVLLSPHANPSGSDSAVPAPGVGRRGMRAGSPLPTAGQVSTVPPPGWGLPDAS